MHPATTELSWHQDTQTCTIDSTNPLDVKEELMGTTLGSHFGHRNLPAATEVVLVTVLVPYQAKFRNRTVDKLSTNPVHSPLLFRVRRDPQWPPSGAHRLPGRHHLHSKIQVSFNGYQVLPQRTCQQCCPHARSFLLRLVSVNDLLFRIIG